MCHCRSVNCVLSDGRTSGMAHPRCDIALLLLSEPAPREAIPQGTLNIDAAPQIETRGATWSIAAKPLRGLFGVCKSPHHSTPAVRYEWHVMLPPPHAAPTAGSCNPLPAVLCSMR